MTRDRAGGADGLGEELHSAWSVLAEICKGEMSLAADFEERLRAFADRWQYSEDQLEKLLEDVHANPCRWTQRVASIERLELEFAKLKRPDA
ncbi:MAG: hypothetical protein WD793_02590 [Steroidobacteraceae bacterium]